MQPKTPASHPPFANMITAAIKVNIIVKGKKVVQPKTPANHPPFANMITAAIKVNIKKDISPG